MRIHLPFLVLWIFYGCATPATSFLAVGYDKPKPQAPGPSYNYNVALETNTVSNKLIIPAVYDLTTIRAAVLVPGFTRPEVGPGDPWSIVLSKVRISDAYQGFFDGAPNIAVLLRVTTGNNSEIDGKWILAAAQEQVAVPSFLNFDNLLVWSGITNQTITIDLQLVKLNKVDKERMAGYLSLASLIAGAIPTYGNVANAIVKAGEAINETRNNYTVLLNYRAGFYPSRNLRYAAYALLPQDIAKLRGETLWYDRTPDELKSGDEGLLDSNWCTFLITKGSFRTFEYGRAGSLDEIRLVADQWVKAGNAIPPTANLRNAFGKLASSVEAERIISTIDFRSKLSLTRALTALKQRQAHDDPLMRLNDDDYNRFFLIVASYFPEELIPSSNSIDEWLKAAQKLDNYNFDDAQERWVKKSGSTVIHTIEGPPLK